MAIRSALHLHEEVVLLSLAEADGRFLDKGGCAFAVAGAVLSELRVLGRIELTGKDRRPTVEVTGRQLTDDVVLDDALGRIVASKKPRRLSTWVSRLGGSNARDRTAERLERLGLVRAERRKVLVVFNSTRYPLRDPQRRQRLVGRLREAVFEDGEVDERTRRLLAIADGAGLLRKVFDRKALKARRDWLTELVEGDPIRDAVRAAITAAQSVAFAGA